MALTAWECLLGLPLEAALEKARSMGAEPVVRDTCAPRRADGEGGTRRVIRVRMDGDRPELTVSAFMDGDPRKPE